MLLFIDIGNTRMTFGISVKGTTKEFNIETDKIKTEDEFGLFTINIFEILGLNYKDVKAIVFSSVVPRINNLVIKGSQKFFNVKALLVEPGIKTGIKINIDNPKELGGDLIVDALSAHTHYPGNNLIINLGTATKISYIDSLGIFQGVAISPGFEIISDLLSQKAAQIPKTRYSIPTSPLGKNTVDSLSAGNFYGHVGLISEMIFRVKKKYGSDCNVILTGGLGEYFKNSLHGKIDYFDPKLTLKGLEIVYLKNFKEKEFNEKNC